MAAPASPVSAKGSDGVRFVGRLTRWTAVAAAWLTAFSAFAASSPPGAAIKAAYVTKFAPFVVWPPSAFAGPTAPLVLCVQGDDPFGAMLDQLTADQRVGSHPMIVRHLARIDAESGCHIAYLAGSPAQSQAAAIRALEGSPVLTVTDAEADGGAAGVVRLVLVDGRVRFVIDAGRAGQCRLVISSKLLALAAEVRR